MMHIVSVLSKDRKLSLMFRVQTKKKLHKQDNRPVNSTSVYQWCPGISCAIGLHARFRLCVDFIV